MANLRDEIITSRKNPLIVRTAKLSDKKQRDAEGLFRIDGVKLFEEAVRSGIRIEYIFIAESRRERILHEIGAMLEQIDGTVIFVSDEVLDKLTDEAAPQGILAVAHRFETLPADVPEGSLRALWLSGIRDPGNLGTMIRTAYAFGVERVYISRDSADIYSPKVIRAAMGTIFRQKLTMIDDELAFAAQMQAAGCELYAAALNRRAKRLGSFPLPPRMCVAVGNEGHGLSAEFIEACSGTLFIPMAEGCESLNAAAAATVLVWEMSRDGLV